MDLKVLTVPSDVEQRGTTLFYLDMISKGTSPKMAEMLAMQQAPGIGITNTQYLQDQNRWGTSILDRMNGDHRAVERLRKGLAKKGYKLKADDHYISSAANGFADPNAIVNSHQTFSELEKRVEESAKIRAETPPKEKVALNPQIVERIRQRKISENPDLARKDQREVIAGIINDHGSKS